MAAFPALKTVGTVEIRTQYPYAEHDEFAVVVNELECGKAYSTNWKENSPEDRIFVIRLNVIEREELQILEDFFDSMGGRVGTFTFNDDSGVTWPKCRFDQDTLRPEYVGINQYNVEARIRAIKW